MLKIFQLTLIPFLCSASEVGAQLVADFPSRFSGARVTMGRVRGSAPNDTLIQLGAFIQTREAQLRYCYAEQGLQLDSTLTGFVRVAFYFSDKMKADSVLIRSMSPAIWRGRGGESANACIRQKVMAWIWPNGLRKGVYAFDLGFLNDPERTGGSKLSGSGRQ